MSCPCSFRITSFEIVIEKRRAAVALDLNVNSTLSIIYFVLLYKFLFPPSSAVAGLLAISSSLVLFFLFFLSMELSRHLSRVEIFLLLGMYL